MSLLLIIHATGFDYAMPYITQTTRCLNVGKSTPYMDPWGTHFEPKHLHHISTATHIHILQVRLAAAKGQGSGKVGFMGLGSHSRGRMTVS